MNEPDLLFVYGSLMSGGERAAFLDRDHKVRFRGTATARGTLYDLGEFVGMIDDPGEKIVHGELYEVIDGETFFSTLDVIEGCWSNEPARSLYVRRRIPVETSDGVVDAYAYIYNQPVNGFPSIAGGRARRIRT
jgi:gamma-glutamylcyclotransferase (GGCT)/AIG2-like uncharacterized protein YtfP